MQNIPSHATDIRHLFRATPRGHELLDCDTTEKHLFVKLPRYYFVKTPTGEVEVCNLKTGDEIQLDHDGELTTRVILKIDECIEDSALLKIIVDEVLTDEETETTPPVSV